MMIRSLWAASALACASFALSAQAAETVGQRLLELGVFHHVVDEHGFVESKFFYRFRADEETIPA